MFVNFVDEFCKSYFANISMLCQHVFMSVAYITLPLVLCTQQIPYPKRPTLSSCFVKNATLVSNQLSRTKELRFW